MSDPKIARLLQLYDEETKNERGPERALYLLLRKYESELPQPDECFHAAFRKTDVTGSADIDMVIWNLLHRARDFWWCMREVNGQNSILPVGFSHDEVKT